MTNLLVTYQALEAPALESICSMVLFLVAYVQFLAVSQGWVSLTVKQLRFLFYFLHLQMIPSSVAAAQSANEDLKFMIQNLHVAGRFGLVLVCLEPEITIPFQVLYTFMEVAINLMGFAKEPVAALCCGHFFVLAVIIAVSLFIHLALRAEIQASLDSANAESLTSCFRRLLRGVCDGEVLLDSQMNVARESECLKHLILTDVSLIGRSFEHLLVDEDRKPFGQFIESSTQAYMGPESKDSLPPLCSRISLRGSAGIRVATDIFHVPVPGLFRADEPYHLIAFKEDLDSRPQPEAGEDAIPEELLPTRSMPHPENLLHRNPASIVSRSSGNSSCVHHSIPELQEMTLLVDADTQLLDVQEAHLKFSRDTEPDDLASALQSSMPSLRKLVRPTDWDKVQYKVARFAAQAASNPAIQPKALKETILQLPDGSRVKAKEAFLKRTVHAQKVWLHLKEFHPEKIQNFSPLEGIRETMESQTSRPAFRNLYSGSEPDLQTT